MNDDTKTRGDGLILVEENNVFDEKVYTDLGFQPLTEYDVRVNLQLLGNISEGEKLMICNGKSLVVDQRYFQFVRRGLSGDSRQKIIEFVKYIKDCARDICKIKVDRITSNIEREINMKGLNTMQQLLSAACTGIGRLAGTYKDDKANLSNISAIQEEIKNFCTEHMAKAVAV